MDLDASVLFEFSTNAVQPQIPFLSLFAPCGSALLFIMSGTSQSRELEDSSRLFHESRNYVQIVHSLVGKNGMVEYLQV